MTCEVTVLAREPETPAAASSGLRARKPGKDWLYGDDGRDTYSAYPFAGIVGMADLKLALLLNAVSPAIGGVLVRGEKGTAKSTMVRGLAALLPPVPVVPGCPYSCDPPMITATSPSCRCGDVSTGS